jgi:hypothetical protein
MKDQRVQALEQDDVHVQEINSEDPGALPRNLVASPIRADEIFGKHRA